LFWLAAPPLSRAGEASIYILDLAPPELAKSGLARAEAGLVVLAGGRADGVKASDGAAGDLAAEFFWSLRTAYLRGGDDHDAGVGYYQAASGAAGTVVTAGGYSSVDLRARVVAGGGVEHFAQAVFNLYGREGSSAADDSLTPVPAPAWPLFELTSPEPLYWPQTGQTFFLKFIPGDRGDRTVGADDGASDHDAVSDHDGASDHDAVSDHDGAADHDAVSDDDGAAADAVSDDDAGAKTIVADNDGDNDAPADNNGGGPGGRGFPLTVWEEDSPAPLFEIWAGADGVYAFTPPADPGLDAAGATSAKKLIFVRALPGGGTASFTLLVHRSREARRDLPLGLGVFFLAMLGGGGLIVAGRRGARY
jgi:hypothetical protein